MNEHVIDYLNNQIVKLERINRITSNVLYHTEYDLSEAKGTHNYLLKYRMKPLLDDAIDAIEIEEPRIAAKRIGRVLKLISN